MPAVWWLVFTVLLLVIEMVTPGLFYFACLAAGALFAALAVFLGAGPITSWAVFFGGSTALILTVAPLARRWMARIPRSPVGLDSLVGQRARVMEALDPATGKGLVRLESGALWSAASETPIEASSWVQVLAVAGTRLRVASDATDSNAKGASHD